MTVKGTARGKTIELDAPLPYPPGQELRVEVEPVDNEAPLGSPARVLEAVRRPPHVTAEDVAELLRAIEDGKLPPIDRGVFDEPAGDDRP